MGVCLTSCKSSNKDVTEVQVNASTNNTLNQKGGKKLKRIKTKFPRKTDKNNDDDDKDEDEEKNQNQPSDNKNNNGNNNENNKVESN